MAHQPIHLSLSSFPGVVVEEALTLANAGVSVPFIGTLDARSAQICPQNRGVLTVARAHSMREALPSNEFRLHANVRVLQERMIVDVADFDAGAAYWMALREVHHALGATKYTAHAGMRKSDNLQGMMEKAKRLADFLGCPVAVEGHYPARKDPFLMSTWSEWETAFRAGVPVVVDVSHAAIIANITRCRRDDLVKEMMASPLCLEVHLSGNDGFKDQHRALSGDEWWWPLLEHVNPAADLFYEGAAAS